jgi:alpha-galactosidase
LNGVSRGELYGRPAWILQTRTTAVLLCLGPRDALLLPYWGPSGNTNRPADYLALVSLAGPLEAGFLDGMPLAYPTLGDTSFKEPSLVVSRQDGSRIVRLTFVEDRIGALESNGSQLLELVFRDELTALEVTQRIDVLTELDLVVRSVRLVNTTSEPLLVERVYSAALPLTPGEYDALTLHGQWGREFQLQRRSLLPGRFVTDSRRGLSSHEAHPWFAIRPREHHNAHAGPVWFGSLAWSGNWTAVFEREQNDALNVTLGIQSFDFGWNLEPGADFVTPELVLGYSEEGTSGASRLLHAYEATVQLPANHRQQPRKVIYNSWEATLFDVREDQQLELARRAAELGVELFVVDDGWFGARNHDRAGLGDWTVNRSKLPRGLTGLIEEVHRLGLQFGIWVEPEMVNPDSDLYRAHPDWAYHALGRESTSGRHQLVLNFARPEVVDALHLQLRSLLNDNGRIDFVKWDHNRAWTEVGWPEEPSRQREVWVRHVYGVYDLLSRLRSEFPHVVFEACAGGGGRADLGILHWTDQVWTSDNTEAADRLSIQYGYSHAHTPRTMTNWVTDIPNRQTARSAPLEFRFHVAMQGVLGIGGNISEWSTAELAVARDYIAFYKRIRPVVQFGAQYWLMPPAAIGPCGVQYVSTARDQTVVMLYQVRGVLGAGVRRARLHGLEPARRYRRESDGAESTGATLMGAGVPLDLSAIVDGRPVLDWRSRIDVWRAVA